MPRDVQKLAQALQDAGAMNLDMKVSDMLKIEGVGDIDPSSAVASTVIAWDGYVLVYGAMDRSLNSLPATQFLARPE